LNYRFKIYSPSIGGSALGVSRLKEMYFIIFVLY
jgi:hypothetical protein